MLLLQKYIVTRLPLSTKVTSKKTGRYSDLRMVNCKWLIINHLSFTINHSFTVAGQCRTPCLLLINRSPGFPYRAVAMCAAHPGGGAPVFVLVDC